MKDTNVPVGKMIHEYKDRIFPENLEEIIGHPDYPMKSVPVEKWEKEFDEKFGDNLSLDGPFDKSYAKLVLAPALKDFISQAIQAAKEEGYAKAEKDIEWRLKALVEEERNRIVLEIEEKMKTRGRYYLRTVESGGLYNEGLEDATTIINKHQ